MKSRSDAEAIRLLGKMLIKDASKFAELLEQHGADATRCLEADDPTPHYDLQPKICIPAGFADCLLALMVGLTPRPTGRPPKQSTLYARRLTAAGVTQRAASRLLAQVTKESPEVIRVRLAVRKKTRSRKPRLPKPGSLKPR